MFGSLGPLEILIIFVIVLIVFGADRLPELARGLGKGIREFKRAADDVKREIMIDPDLNLDLNLNEPLPSKPDQAYDPYKYEDQENEKPDTVSQPEESKDLKGEIEKNESEEDTKNKSEADEKIDTKKESENYSDENYSEDKSEKKNLAG